uniref:testicular haploid expressed gene protein-like isoform X2 n=1 Tax=Gasterosteus aculeatus aculeatus TaxID=481459 RepID=UPI001A98D0C0|nr:testicular haploid expressed gene protein-like isoform X2 [Gasterosteus aculeatus aculeatus]
MATPGDPRATAGEATHPTCCKVRCSLGNQVSLTIMAFIILLYIQFKFFIFFFLAGLHSGFGPSKRVSELARHKTSKTVWATTPCGKLSWGTQEPIWPPPSAAALGAVPSARIQHLARHKRDFSVREDQRRKEEASFSRKTRRPSSEASRYERFVRLSAPRTRSGGSRDAGPPHTPPCDNNGPIWHLDAGTKPAVITPRLLRLADPKRNHPDFWSNSEGAASVVSLSSQTARPSQRLVRLSLPRLRGGDACRRLGRPAEPIWTVSKAAMGATASARLEMLALPKRLSEGYVPPREPGWSRNTVTAKSAKEPQRG